MPLMSEEYTPTQSEERMADSIDGLINELLDGELLAVGVCATYKDGTPAFFYLNKPNEPVLRTAINRLMGLYESGHRFGELVNAPRSNRSYRSH
jgi:hypothetical protein